MSQIFYFAEIYHGLHSDDPCTGVQSFCSCDELKAVFLFTPVDVGDTDPIFRVRLVEAGNTGETWSGEGGGDGNGIITGCKGAMY